MPTKTMRDFSYEAARCYLQTAVFVDDRIYEPETGKVSPGANLQAPERRKPAVVNAAPVTPTASPANVVSVEDPKGRFSAQDIVVSFANQGIVCGLYQPNVDSLLDATSEACKLCLNADIVLIDWDLYGDAGKRTQTLVSALVKRGIENLPEQLRLVVIYTGEPSLDMVLDRIYECLSETLEGNVKPVRDALGLALHTENSRVVVLGKPDLARSLGAERVVEESALAPRAVQEYSVLASGLLQGAVLRALGEIRRNSRRILTRFDSCLDPAYLTHRALSLPHDDASDHVLPLVMGEVQAVLEDREPLDGEFSGELLADWVETRWKVCDPLPEAIRVEPRPKEVVLKLIREGASVGQTGVEPWKSLTKKEKDRYEWAQDRSIPVVVGACVLGATPKSTHENFSALMSLRKHYESATRMLRLGTILSGPDNKFFVCLQPECDCIRLKLNKNRAFLFVETFEVQAQGDADVFHLVVEAGATFRRFRLSPKVFRSHVETFMPDKDTRTVKADADDGKWAFRSADGQRTYSWLGQLKPDYAQRVAATFAAELARVGLTESEWLRRMGSKEST